jgi:hypothetical protein
MRGSRLQRGTARLQQGVAAVREHGSRNVAFYLFCAFLITYFGRFPRRVALLGALHFDLLFGLITLVAVVMGAQRRDRRTRQVTPRGDAWTRLDPIAKRLWILFAYIVVTLPLVQWPGSVVHNLETWVKSVLFFVFVVATVDTTRKLKVLLAIYAATQVWRILEPLYMHVAWGYWGGIASVGNWEYIDRLSGSPYDIINPNGIGFVVVMTLPLLHFLVKPDTTVRRIIWAAIAIAMCYALVLSASRSGFLALVFLCLFAIWRSKHRAGWLLVGVAGAIVALALMNQSQRDRYVSIYNHDAPGGGTAQGRITGVIEDFEISLRRPLFGHGLGTSLEVNAHYRGEDMPSHDLYTETAMELGYVGLILVLALIWSFLRTCWTAQQVVKATPMADERLRFLHDVASSLVVVVAVDLFFSFASYGLSEPYWYLIGGLAVVTTRLAVKLAPAVDPAAADQAAARGRAQPGTRKVGPHRGRPLRGGPAPRPSR